MAAGPLLLGQHNLLSDAASGVDHQGSQEVPGKPIPGPVADHHDLTIFRIGQIEVCLSLFSDQNLIILEEQGRVDDQEGDRRIVGGLEPIKRAPVLRLEQRESVRPAAADAW